MKKERRKSMQGTVLFTTVSVMALLIIFLMGTLVLSSASNTRAHKTYSTSQASYTARAAIDAFIEAAARDTGIQAAITGLGDGGKIEADMVLSDPSLGEVGYVDQSTGNWVKDKIIIESVANDNVYEYLDDNNNQGANAKWVKLAKVKVTASVRVGKEVETVSALIKKRGAQPAVPPQTINISPNIKGIQSLGDGYWPAGGRINGGLGVSLGDVDDPQGHLAIQRNDQVLQTTLSFINSSALIATSSFRVAVHKTMPGVDKDGNPTAAETPFSATVITGNLYIPNNEFVSVEYKKEADTSIDGDYTLDYSKWTNKDVPYVYIDGAFKTSSSYVKFRNPNKSPFNLFAGTIDGLLEFESGNIYMMDPVAGNEPYSDADVKVKYNELHPEVYKVKNDQNNTNASVDVARGKNYLELNAGNLYKWVDSIENHSEVSATALGGSIFCNGDLKINMKKAGTIDGDIRVEGNLELEGESFTVDGDVIVGGNATGFEKITVTAGHTKKANAKTSQGGGDTSNINITPIENKIVNEPLNQALLETVNPQFENLKVYYYEWVPSTHPKKHLDDNNTLITEYVDPWGKEITFSDTATDENGVPTEATRPIYYRWNDDFTANMFPANWENDWVNEVNLLDEYDKCDQNEHFKQIRTYLVDEKIITRPKNSYDDDDKYYYGVPKAIVAEDGILQGYTATGRIADVNETYQYYPPTKSVMTSTEVENYSTGVRKRHDINGQPTADDAGENEYTYYADA
ncbi:MAG: polymer-forming cytoskeletal protein, partial [Ruminococcus sp.]|nr:polymer-forming cytoskeletal protein [Ruminococcus sp.]